MNDKVCCLFYNLREVLVLSTVCKTKGYTGHFKLKLNIKKKMYRFGSRAK